MVIDIYTTDKKYKTIYIDPPWIERVVCEGEFGKSQRTAKEND